jgi:Trypsin
MMKSKRSSWIPTAIAATLGGVSASGCAVRLSHQAMHTSNTVRPAALSEGEARSKPTTLRFDPPIAIATDDDAIVRLVTKASTCTGTLIADDLVLTAKHCVVTLGPDGLNGPNGSGQPQLVLPGSIQVELGGDYLAWGRVLPKHIVVPPCGEFGGAGDLAILVLERKLVGVPTLQARLAKPPHVGESLDPVGFGRCATSNGVHRVRREGGMVQAITGETLHMLASVCPGDSGGPVLSRDSGEVVGVVSMSAMDSDASTRSASVMARLDAYRDVFAAARAIADGTEPNELPPISCAK